ncbi:MAG: hypothetical protein LBG17_03205 [Bacteroidales bacterium]|jgi:hypothetical protein|nr:hypothetical protein [Bacteroidales bacterium]
MYRLFIEKRGKDYVVIKLQHKPKNRWETKEVEFCPAVSTNKFENIVRGYSLFFGITPDRVIDTRYSYKGVSLLYAAYNEIRLSLEYYIWNKQFNRLKRYLKKLHIESGKRKETRRKYWIMTDYKGFPMMMSKVLKDNYKAKGWYSRAVGSYELDRECLWSTDDLYK